MDKRRQQEQEIVTIKEREMKISLSDADMRRLWKKAGSAGMTAGGLLASFIGDLVNGTYTNGSDERMIAGQWFDRCSMFAPKTFLCYLIEWGTLESVLSDDEEISDAKDDLAELEVKPDKDGDDLEEIKSLKDYIAYCQGNLDRVFSEFVEWCGDNPHGSYEEEMRKLRGWYKNMDDLDQINFLL